MSCAGAMRLGDAAVRDDDRAEREAVDVVDLARRQRAARARSTSLPVERIATRGLREHLDVGAADRGERADAARVEQIAGGDHAIAGGDVGAAPADVLAGRGRREESDTRPSPASRVSSTITTASAPSGSGAPVAISAHVPGADGRRVDICPV